MISGPIASRDQPQRSFILERIWAWPRPCSCLRGCSHIPPYLGQSTGGKTSDISFDTKQIKQFMEGHISRAYVADPLGAETSLQFHALSQPGPIAFDGHNGHEQSSCMTLILSIHELPTLVLYQETFFGYITTQSPQLRGINCYLNTFMKQFDQIFCHGLVEAISATLPLGIPRRWHQREQQSCCERMPRQQANSLEGVAEEPH